MPKDVSFNPDQTGLLASFEATSKSSDALSKLLSAWEGKNAKTARRLGGLGLVAIPLAACGGGSDNASPIAVNDTVTTEEDVPVLIDALANDTDANSADTLTITDVGGGANGSAQIEDGKIRYTPDADFFGSDSISYTISDGKSTDTGSITISVASDEVVTLVNVGGVFSLTETVTGVTLLDSSAATLIIENDLVDNERTITFDASNLGDQDKVTFQFEDAGDTVVLRADSTLGDVAELEVVAGTVDLSALADANVNITDVTLNSGLVFNAVDFLAVTSASGSGELTIVVASQAEIDAVVEHITTLDLEYDVSLQKAGNALSDEQIASGNAAAQNAVEANVTNNGYILTVDQPAVTEADGAATKVMVFTLTLDRAPAEDVIVNYTVGANSTANPGDDFTATAGAVTFAAGETSAEVVVTVLSDDIAEGNETVVLNFTGESLVSAVTASGTIVEDDASFVFTSPSSFSVAEGTSDVGSVAGADADSTTLTTTMTGADSALFSLTNGSLSFNAAPDFETPGDADSDNVYNVTVTVTDGSGNATSQDLAITVTDENDETPTITSGATGSVAENADAATVVYTATSTDADAGDSVSYSVSGTDAAAVSISAAGAVTLNVSADFETQSSYSFDITATDAGGNVSTQSVTVSVTDVNETPVAVDDAAAVITGNSVTIDVLANDTDPDTAAAFNTLSISGTPTASVGDVAVVGNQLVYTAPNGFQGDATISYSVTDGTNASVAPATVTVRVGEPIVTAASSSVDEGTDIVFSVKGVENTSYDVYLDYTNLNGAADETRSVTTDANGDATITIATDADRTTEGAQSVSASITGTLSAPVSVTVNDSSLDNTAPVAADASETVAEGATASGQLVATDVDAEDAGDHTFSTTDVVAGFTLNADGSWSFDATDASYNSLAVGQTSVQTVNYTVNDNATDAGNGALADTGVLTITVTGTNDAPVVTVGDAAPTVTENTTAVTTYATSDVDDGDTLSAITLSGEDAALFQYVAATGAVEFRTAPDFEDPTDANRDGIYNVTINVTDNNGATGSQSIAVTVADGPEVAQFFDLTVGTDAGPSFTGDSGDDTFFAGDDVASGTPRQTLTTGDTLDGGDGDDTLNVTGDAAIDTTGITGLSISNIETATITSGAAITANTTGWTGLTALNTATSGAAQTITAAATTNIVATVGAQAATAIAVNGGNDVTVTATGTTTGTVTVGATTAAAGDVVVNVTSSTAGTTGAIAVTGGDSITVNSAAANAVNTTVVQSAVTATGDAQTTSVTVNQDATATAAAAVVGKTAGAVTIADANAASSTAAGTIATVTLDNYGASTINSSALTTVNISGTAGTLGITHGTLTTDIVSALTINTNGLSGTNAITVLDTGITTLNINGTAAASTIANVTAAGVTTLNFGGDADTALTTSALLANVTDINVTGSGGVTLGTTAVAAAADFDGGAGDDTITLTTGFTQGITMGGGDDTVTYGGAAGTGGSVDFGTGTSDTIIMTSAQAASADDTAAFNTTFTNFEVLSLSDVLAATTTLNLAGLGGVTEIVLTSGGADVATSVLDNVASGSTITTAAGTGFVAQVANAAFSNNDVINIEQSAGGAVAAGQITANNVETINFLSDDTIDNNATMISHTGTLVADAVETITFTGDAGYTLTYTGTTVTNVNASGLTVDPTGGTNGLSWTSGALASAATVTGGEGNDVINLALATAAVTVDGGAGADQITGGLGVDTLTGGAGADTFIFNSATNVSGTANPDVITDFSAAATGGDSLNITFNAGVAGAGNIVANATQAGVAAGVTATVTDGVLALSGVGASAVDTLGEWLVEASAVAAAPGALVAFEFDGDTYVFGEDSAAANDLLIHLDGLTGVTDLAAAAAANTIVIA